MVNGKNFNQLSKDDRAKLREEFKEMEKAFEVTARARWDVFISRNDKGPKALVWNDDSGEGMSFKFSTKTPGDFRYLAIQAKI